MRHRPEWRKVFSTVTALLDVQEASQGVLCPCCGQPKEAVKRFLSAGTWPVMLFLAESLSEPVGRLKPLSRHQPTFGLGRANESHLHSSLAKKKPYKILLSCTQEFLRKIYFHGNLQFFALKRNFTISLNQKWCHFYHLTSHFFPSVQNHSSETWAWKNLQALEGQIQRTDSVPFTALGSGLTYKYISLCGCNPSTFSSWQMRSRSQETEQI